MNRPVRRSQAISPFGVGALVDFPGPVSLVHAGLDAWPFDPSKPEHREFKVEDEPRLARRLGVDFFVQPPDFRAPNSAGSAEAVNVGLKLPFLRFPLWHSCPRCGRMFETRYQDRAAPQCTGPVGSGGDKGKLHKPRRTVQVRFVTVCRDGHIRDFPWIEWLGLEPEEWNRTRSDRWLRLLSTGSASIAGVIVVAERQQADGIIEVKRKSLAGAFGDGLGIKCDSQIPALSIGDGGDVSGEACPQKLQAVLRGASNLYFSDVRSSIYIPEVRDASFPPDVLDILDDHEFKQELLNAAIISDDGTLSRKAVSVILKRRRPESGVDTEALANAANKHVLHEALTQHRLTATMLAMRAGANGGCLTAAIVAEVIHDSHVSEWEIDPALLVAPLNAWLETRNGEASQEGLAADTEYAEGAFRFEEYAAFCRDGQEGMPKINLLVRSHSTGSYAPIVRDRFSRIALLDKLRETRAFVGYSRLFAASAQDSSKRWKLISRERKNWLPAIVVRGEGIFLVFDSDKLDRWNTEHGAFHRQRLVEVNRNLHAQAMRREIHAQDVEPKFVLLHTFAHVVISQLTFDCGYGSSSLRERIYFSEDHPRMSGVLIYTAAGDSEGTLGGLVRMGSPGLLERTIARALDRARWCSSDPVCIESPGQGPDNCNLAACHSCALLPETSCEHQNRLLDRGMLIGTLDRPETGFFSGGD
ncbi:DrmB family protein [Acidovorax sp.]|uniref:DrmB family protein n=1 Tax=Acidovorax sp. TaxID=1872122 RepID=UPI00391D9425